MKGTKNVLKRLLAAMLALVMVLTYVVVGDSTTSYAKTSKATTKAATTVDAISVSYKINYAYEGQKFNETTFRKNATVKVKKKGRIKTVKDYTVSAPTYVKSNGTGKNRDKFLVKVTYGKKSTYMAFNIRKISKIYVKSSGVTMVENGTAFNSTSFKKKTTVYARYKVGKTYKEFKLPTYKVSAAKTVSANARAKKYKGYFYVNVKYGNHTATRYIPVIKGIKASSSLKTLNEGEKLDATAFKKSVTVTRYFASGKTSKVPASSFKLVNPPSTVRFNSNAYPNSVGVKIQSGSKATYAYVKINPLSKIAVTSNKIGVLNEGTTFNEKDFRKKVTVKSYYATDSANKNITGYTVSVPSKTVKPDKNGKYVVTIKYGSKSTTVPITVSSFKQINATLEKDYPLYEGETFDAADFKQYVTVYSTYTNSTRTTPVTNFTLTVENKVTPDSNGNFNITIKSGSNSTTLAVPVKRIDTFSAKIQGQNYTLKAGQAFDVSVFRNNVDVSATYGITTRAVEDYTISIADGTIVKADENGKFVVTVTFAGETATVSIPVIKDEEPVLDNIEASIIDSEYTLKADQAFDESVFRSSVNVIAHYGSTEKPVEDYTISVANGTIVKADENGKFVVTITFADKTTTVSIPVIKDEEPVLDNIEAYIIDSGYTLKADQAFDESVFRSKVSVNAIYGVTTTTVNDYTISVADGTIVKADKNNNFVVTITFADKTTTVAIPVEAADNPTPEATVSEITVSSNIPYLYNGTEVDDTLKATIENSLTVIATMSDGSTKTLDSSLYKVRTVTRVVVYTGESGGFRVDVDYSDDITGKCYIPVITGIVIHPKDTSASFELTKGASYTKEDFLKLFDVFDIYGDQHEETCKEYEFIAPETVYANGEGEFAGQFVVKVTSNSGNFSYSVSYKIIDGGTVNPDPTPVGGQEVDWLTFYGEKYSTIPDDSCYWISIFAEKNEPSDCGPLKDCGIVVSFGENANPEPTIEKCNRNYCQTNVDYTGWSQTFNLDSSNSVTDDSIIYVRVYAETTDGNVYYSKVLSFKLGNE